MFEHNGLNPSYLVGGIKHSQGARSTDSEWLATNTTRRFSTSAPSSSITSRKSPSSTIEFDHANIFDDLDAIKKTFSHFIRLVRRNGLLLGNGDERSLAPLLDVTHCP